jgi:regulator of RNase E activity RraA
MTAEITLPMIREKLSTPLVCDALDGEGLRNQSPRLPFRALTISGLLVGRCRTTLWTNMAHVDPRPYELELQAVDACQPDEVVIASASGSNYSGVWGELLSTAARNRGCVGVIVDGMVRDVRKMRSMNFPVYALGTSPYDSQNRQRVVDLDVPVQVAGVRFCPGDLVLADEDGVVVVPRDAEKQVLARAWQKAHAENVTRDAIRGGMLATDAYRKYGVL